MRLVSLIDRWPARRHFGPSWRLAVAAACCLVLRAQASTPPTGTIAPTGPTLTWVNSAVGTGAEQESLCMDGINCDTFTVNVLGAPSDWQGLALVATIRWSIDANDYDLYVHKDSNAGATVGTSAGGAPETQEQVVFYPAETGTGVYTIHTVYFATTPELDQPQGTLTVESGIGPRYFHQGITFADNVTVSAPATVRDGEPSNRTDVDGNCYVAGIRGLPAGVDMWYFDLRPTSAAYDPLLQNPTYRGQPDAFSPDQVLQVGADGGGDVDMATGFGSSQLGSAPGLAFSSLIAANVSTEMSPDLGVTWLKNPAGNSAGGASGDDRQWLAAYGPNIVYLYYRTLDPAVSQIQQSIDGGLTYGPATTAGLIGQACGIDVDQNDGTVYISGSTGQVGVGIPPAPGAAPVIYNAFLAASDPNGVAHIFCPVKVGPDGTVYMVYSNDHDIFLIYSRDKARDWSLPVKIDNGANMQTNVFPWLATGPVAGTVGIVWYGTSDANNDNSAQWNVFYALVTDANTVHPFVRVAQASDHVIHVGNISEGGLLGAADRNLLDYFQVSFDPAGAAVIAYTDDHNDLDGATFVTRQSSGPSAAGGRLRRPEEGPGALPPAPPPADGSQVQDFPQDVTTGLITVTPTNDPLDILSIKYSAQEVLAVPDITATMKVSDLSVIPPDSAWRMSFTANAPDSVLSPTGRYTFGLSDLGDQFFVQAQTDDSGNQSFVYGTTVRNADGSLTYTVQGAADSGSFDQAHLTISVSVSASKLNPFVTHGPSIAYGTVLVGLRGRTYTVSGTQKGDTTRGGTQYTIP